MGMGVGQRGHEDPKLGTHIMSWESCGPAAAGSPSAGRPLRGPDGHVRETASTLGFWGTLGSWPPPAAWSKASAEEDGLGRCCRLQREVGCRLGGQAPALACGLFTG